MLLLLNKDVKITQSLLLCPRLRSADTCDPSATLVPLKKDDKSQLTGNPPSSTSGLP